MNVYKALFVLMWCGFCCVLAMVLHVVVLVKGWGLEPKSWPWIIGITAVSTAVTIITAFINSAIAKTDE